MKKYMVNRNDGHPSCDHGLKRKTFSVDLHWLAPRMGFHLSPSMMPQLLGVEIFEFFFFIIQIHHMSIYQHDFFLFFSCIPPILLPQ